MTKGWQETKKKRKMGKEENKGAVRDLVESGAVRDMGWRRAGDLVKSWNKKQRGMRVVEVQ